MTPSHIDPLWVTTDEQLTDCCDRLQRAKAIAVDTEFMRTNTFYPKAALFQIFAGENADGGHCYLIDPLPIGDFSPLVKLFTDPAVIKIFHACSEDLEVFNSFLGCVPHPLVDTQVAAGLLEYGASVSYAALVEKLLGVTLEKGETRSDWLQRPLEPKQQQYAIQDVVYLLPLYEALMAELEQKLRLPWLREDCELLVNNARTPQDPDAFYPRIKSAWKLNRQELAVLQELSRWREEQARKRDMPRNHVLHEAVLWTLAKEQPQTLQAIKAIEGMEYRKFKRVGQEVLEVLGEARRLQPEDYPPRLPAPLPIAQRKLVKALKQRAAEKAGELGMFPEVLAKKSDFEFIVRSAENGGSHQLPERLQGWRRAAVGESLLQVAGEMAHRTEEECTEPSDSQEEQTL